jgi:uncharacterized protein (DUF885 family)
MFKSQAILIVVWALGAGPVWCAESDRILEQLMAEFWQQELAASPLAATAMGGRGFDHLIDRVSDGAFDRRAAHYQQLLVALAEIPTAELSSANRTNHEVLQWLLKREHGTLVSKWRYVPFTTTNGWHSGFAQIVALTRFESEGNYRDYLARLRAFPRYAEENMGLMRRGIALGYTQPCVVLEGYEASIAGYITDDPEESVFFEPFAVLAAGSASFRDALTAEAKQVIAEVVNPAYAKYHAFFVDTYQPNCRESVGLAGLPDGRELYDHFVRFFTTLDTDAEAVHALGLVEVARIRSEMQIIIDGLEFPGSFDDFSDFLRNDPQFYTNDVEAYLGKAAAIAKEVDGKLPEYFAHLPRTPYGISRVPDQIAPKTTTAYYQPGAADGSRAGQYFLNLYDLASRPLYELPALTLHESVPGHHLQIAIQQELEDLPEFRRQYYFHAFGEGWGLYAERLGEEMGIYKTPYESFGRLVYEMWRACRLVVDSGIHAKGWTRQQAIDYMAANTALSMHNISAEVDRYISWPGQALAYKHGEIKIRELRARAEQALGDEFSLREFHALVLTTGAVPLSVLDSTVQNWIDAASVR